MAMYRAPGQNNMLTGQQNAYGADPTRPQGLAKSSPSIARYPASGSPLVRQPAYRDPYADVIQQKLGQADQQPAAAQQMKQAAVKPMAAQAPSQTSEVPGVGMPAAATSMGKVSAAPGAQQAAAPMAPAVSAQQIQDMKQGAFKQMQAGPQQVMQGGQMNITQNASAPGGGSMDKADILQNYENQPSHMSYEQGASTQTSKTGLTPEQQDELNKYTLDQIMNSPYGLSEEVLQKKINAIKQGLEEQAGVDQQTAGFLMGASGLAGSGLSASAITDIDAKKRAAMMDVEANMVMDNAKLAQQEKMQRISDAIQMAQMQGNWDLARELQAEQAKLQREQMNLEFMVQYPQTAYAFKKEAGMSDSDWSLYQQDLSKIDMGSSDAPQQIADLYSRWVRDEAGVPHYKSKSGAATSSTSGALNPPSPEVAAPAGQTTNWKDLTGQQQDALKKQYAEWLKTNPKKTVEVGESATGEKQYAVMNFTQWLQANGYTT